MTTIADARRALSKYPDIVRFFDLNRRRKHGLGFLTGMYRTKVKGEYGGPMYKTGRSIWIKIQNPSNLSWNVTFAVDPKDWIVELAENANEWGKDVLRLVNTICKERLSDRRTPAQTLLDLERRRKK